MPPDEAAVVRFGQEYFRTHRVSRGTFQLVLDQFGRRGAVELGTLLGMYSMLALLVTTFDSDFPENWNEPLMPA